MKKSEWLKIDLHIHSIASNDRITNDYVGRKYTADDLLKIMVRENMNIFSITDHSIFNIELYKEIFEKIKGFEELNFIVGIELDIEDKDVDDDLFHCIMLIDFDDCSLAEDLEQRLKALSERLGLNNSRKSYTVQDLFLKLYDEKPDKNFNFMLIPHYNRKEKSVKKSKAIEFCLNKSFNAFEDRNNIKVIQGILKHKLNEYTEGKAELVFSDCHNIERYPMGKTEKEYDDFYFPEILGNIESPYKSLQLATTDHKLRIRIKTAVDGEHRKNATGIEEVNIKYKDGSDVELEISPYQNSIIGNFASGKSFLMNLIYYGINNDSSEAEEFNRRYHKLLEDIEKVTILYNGNKYNSLSTINVDNFKILKYEQMEGVLHNPRIDIEYKKRLENQFNIKFPEINEFVPKDEVRSTVVELFEKCYTLFNNKANDIFEYSKLMVEPSQPSVEYSASQINLRINTTLPELLKEEKEKSIYEIDIYSQVEQEKLNECIEIITRKIQQVQKFESFSGKYTHILTSEIKGINGTNEQKNQMIVEAKEMMKYEFDKLGEFYHYLENLKQSCDSFEKEYSEDKLEFLVKEKENEYHSFKTLVTYEEMEYNKVELITNSSSLSIFQVLISRILSKNKFKNERSNGPVARLNDLLKKYIEEYAASVNNNNFDIEVASKRILSESGGGRAKMMLDICFEIMKSLAEENNEVLFLVDQPEDQMDNKNIYTEFTRKVRRMKQQNEFPQTIMVSHSGNATIATDSEIFVYSDIGNVEKKYEVLTLDSINDNQKICDVLDGGKEALDKRLNKYSIGD